MDITREDCTVFYDYIIANFNIDKTHEYHIHKKIELWLNVHIKERNFMPSYFLFNSDNKLILLTESPFDARSFIESSPWMVTLPGLCILFVVLGLNLFGDGLRDALDPKLKR